VVQEMVALGLLSKVPSVQRQKLADMTAFRATRPHYSAMETNRLTEILGIPPRSWRDALADYVRQRGLFR
jgi:dTDP-4-dehydrorhamnose reductase